MDDLIKYPEIKYSPRPEAPTRRFMWKNEDFRIDVSSPIGGENAGFWQVIFNNAGMINPDQPDEMGIRYRWNTREEAEAAAKAEMHTRIQLKVEDARRILGLYGGSL